MNSIIYLLQVTACTAVFYLFYFLFLSRLTFFTTNRWYLLVTVLLSFIIPLIKIPVSQPHVYTGVVQQVMNNYSPQEFTQIAVQPQVIKAEPIHWGTILKFTYLTAVLALTVHLMVTLIAFFKRLKNKRITKVGNVHILTGNKKITNGSFLNYIFLNDEELSPDEIKQIIAHEMLHVKLYHSVDRILVKLAQIMLWFNPFIYLYARSVEENHEFEVDRAIARDTDKHNYANLLLHLSVAGQGMLYHNFSKVPLKKRITMLFNKPSANMKRIIYTLIMPVLLISCLAFAGLKSNNENNDLFVRAVLKKNNGDICDKVTVNLGNHATAKANITHNGKVGFILNSKLYSEEEFNELAKKDDEKIKASPYVGVTDKQFFYVLRKMGYHINTTGYDIIFTIGTLEQTNQKEIADVIKAAMADSEAKRNAKKATTFNGSKSHEIYTRTEVKKTLGRSYDIVEVRDNLGSSAKTEVPHNARVGFFIDHDFYTEEAFLKLSAEFQIALSKIGRLGVTDSAAFADLPKRGFKADLTGYAAVFEFDYKLHLVRDEFTKEIDTIKHNKSLQSKNTNWKQMIEDYRKSEDYKRIIREADQISTPNMKEIIVKRKLDATKGDSRDAGFLISYQGVDYDLVTDDDDEFKTLNNILYAGDKLQVKVLGTTCGMNHKRVGFQTFVVMRSNKIIFQYSKSGLYPEKPFQNLANSVRFAVGNISEVKKYPNGKWKSATFTTLNEYRFSLNFKPGTPDIAPDIPGNSNLVYLRFVNEIKTGLKTYLINDWLSISTNDKDYGVKNPELFNKYYLEATVRTNNTSQKGVSQIIQSTADSVYFDKVHHVSYFYGNASIKSVDIEVNSDYVKLDEKNQSLFASCLHKGKMNFKVKKEEQLVTADSVKIDLKTNRAIAWHATGKF